MDNQKIGKFICKLRQDKSLTQKDLADKIGVTDKAISKWECGNGLPDITLLEPLATALDTSVAELLNGEVIANASVEKTDEAIVQAVEHYKWSQRRTAGILLLILGAGLMLAFALSIVGQWYILALVLGIVSIAIGIILVATKKSLAYCKVPKAVAQWIAFGALIAAIVLEALPYGVKAIFVTDP